jgi:hypothetical protein
MRRPKEQKTQIFKSIKSFFICVLIIWRSYFLVNAGMPVFGEQM